MNYDPLGLGRQTELPTYAYLPLLGLGVQDIHQLVQREGDGFLIVPCSYLQEHLQSRGLRVQDIRREHKVALNQVTLILNGDSDEAFRSPALGKKSVIDLPREARLIKRDDITLLLQEHAQSDMPGPLQQILQDQATMQVNQPARPAAFVLDLANPKKRAKPFAGVDIRKDLPELERLLKHWKRRDDKATLAANPMATRQQPPRAAKGQAAKPLAAPGSRAESNRTRLLRSLPPMKSDEARMQYLEQECDIPELIPILYDYSNHISGVSAERLVQGAREYRVGWQPQEMRNHHIPLMSQKPLSYKVRSLQPVANKPGWSLVQWEDSWEPEENVTDHEPGRQCLTAFEGARLPPCKARRKDFDLNGMDRQGIWPALEHRMKRSLALRPDLAQYITIDPIHSINPDKDIKSTGSFELMRSAAHAHLLEVFAPNGTFVGCLTTARASVLQHAFSSQTNDERRSGSFAMHLAALLVRYQDGFEADDARTKQKNHWATPDGYIKALQDGLSINTERFSSPLNFTPTMQHYYTLYKEDGVFGANHDAFSCAWVGASQCNPEYEHEDMDKAVRWALASAAQTETAALTAFVLP